MPPKNVLLAPAAGPMSPLLHPAGECSPSVVLGIAEGFHLVTFQPSANHFSSLVSSAPSSRELSAADIHVPALYQTSPPKSTTASTGEKREDGSLLHPCYPSTPLMLSNPNPAGALMSPTPSMAQGMQEGFAPLNTQQANNTSGFILEDS